jgi:hypothetical protein
MKIISLAFVLLTILEGCNATSLPNPLAEPALTAATKLEQAAIKGDLYVLNTNYFSTITVYKPGGSKPIQTISAGLDLPWAMAMDSQGNLYVANSFTPGSVAVYAPGKVKPYSLITNGINTPRILALDSHDNLYVGNQEGPVSVYAPNSTVPTYQITQGICSPTHLILDESDDLFVGNMCGNVTEYGPGGTTPIRTISELIYGFYGVDTMTVDRAGALYLSVNVSIGKNCILSFLPGSTKAARGVRCGYPFNPPVSGLSIDAHGNLYGAFTPFIAAYQTPSLKLIRTFPKGQVQLGSPQAPVFDSNGNVYVPNNIGSYPIGYNPGSIDIFSPAGSRYIRSITKGINGPSQLLIAP